MTVEKSVHAHYPISKFKEKVMRPALTSHYLCYFPLPAIPVTKKDKGGVLQFASDNNSIEIIDDQEYLSISCCEASLPGFSLLTHEINNDYTGVTERHAYRRAFDDRADFTFYVDSNYTPIAFFHAWLNYIADSKSDTPAQLNTYNYRMRFPEDYMVNELQIVKFERDYTKSGETTYSGTERIYENENDSTISYRFFNAYPISMNSMPVSYESSQLLKCTISFTYSRYIFGNKRIND
jgi:hypothetical protein